VRRGPRFEPVRVPTGLRPRDGRRLASLRVSSARRLESRTTPRAIGADTLIGGTTITGTAARAARIIDRGSVKAAKDQRGGD